jgi:hypothetical protein
MAANACFATRYCITTARHIADRTLALMEREKVLVSRPRRPAFYVWPRPERVILIIDPLAVTNPDKILSGQFSDRLGKTLRRRVVVSNGRSLFVQVAYRPDTSAAMALPDRIPLDLTTRPNGQLMIPLGVTHRRSCWLSLLAMDSVLIGGTRRMGKTTILHGWILALVTGEPAKRVRLILADGKDGAEFGRYAGLRHVDAIAGTGEQLTRILSDLRGEMAQRHTLMTRHGKRTIEELPTDARLPYIVLIIDELAANLETPGVEGALQSLVAKGGACGVLPVLATQRPESKLVAGFLKCNLATRISLPVPGVHDSRIILSRGGAEKLPKKKGRILFEWDGRMVEAQAYDAPTELITQIVGRLRTGQAPLEPPLAIEGWQKQLIRIALAPPFNGRFGPYKALGKASGISHRQIGKLAQTWELQGLLGPVEYEEGTGRKLSRRITDRLRTLDVD